MTINEFAQKYDIKYQTVYSATWLIKQQNGSWRSKEYDENDLRDAVKKMLLQRYHKARKEMDKNADLLDKLGIVTEI